MYIVELKDLTLIVKDGKGSKAFTVELADATSLGQRITNGKLLSKMLRDLRVYMAAHGATRVEADDVENDVLNKLHQHSAI